jgi:hypothetical protein
MNKYFPFKIACRSGSAKYLNDPTRQWSRSGLNQHLQEIFKKLSKNGLNAILLFAKNYLKKALNVF